MIQRIGVFVAAAFLCAAVHAQERADNAIVAERTDAPRLAFQKNDRVIFLGNTFAERLRHFGYFETLLLTQFPDLNLTFRNLGWSADEVALRPRPLDFGEIHDHLSKLQADVIFVCYGSNESFKGAEGLPQFEQDLASLLDALLGNQYNGESAPRLAIVSPIPQEPFEFMPDVSKRNADIGVYTEAMRRIASAKGIPFLDLYHGVSLLMDDASTGRLTFNGVHLTEYGDWAVSHVMLEQLLGGPPNAMAVNAGDLERTADGYRVNVASAQWQIPGPPDGSPAPPTTLPFEPVFSVNNLPEGRYAVRIAGDTIAETNAQALAQGIRLDSSPARKRAEALRETVVYKNQLFFDRWRAVNGYYIYGGRKEPFGVVSFPPEMARFDERVAGFDEEINERLTEPIAMTIEIVKLDS